MSLVLDFGDGVASPVDVGGGGFLGRHPLLGQFLVLHGLGGLAAVDVSQEFLLGQVTELVDGFAVGDFSFSVFGVVLLDLGQVVFEDGQTANFLQGVAVLFLVGQLEEAVSAGFGEKLIVLP